MGKNWNEIIQHLVAVRDTQAGIIEYAEAMAQVLASAAIASQKATGDSAEYALDRWVEVIRKRAKELICEQREDGPLVKKMRAQMKAKELTADRPPWE